MSTNFSIGNFKNQKNKLQKNARSFFPKSKNLRSSQTKIQVEESKNIDKNGNNRGFASKKRTKIDYQDKVLNLQLNLGAKEYFPNKEKLKNQEKEKEEKEEREKKQQEKEQKLKNEYIYSYEYLIQFETWEVSNQTEFLPEDTLKHINGMKEYLKETEQYYSMEKFKNNYSNCNTSKSSSSSNINFSMEQWARKDYTKENEAAEENKKKFEENDKKDSVKKELRSILNIITKDNYDETKIQILEIIKENVEYQEQFLNIFFIKAVMEKSYAELYAKLCKYLNKMLPQKTKKSEKSKNISTIFRDKLIGKCREVFKTKNYDEFIKEKEPKEREIKLKKFIIGNVNFITELIKIKMLSKKIIPDCIDYVFERYEKEDSYLKLIYAQAIVLFTDKFGSLVNSEKSKKSEETENFKKKIEDIFEKLEKIKNDKDLPSHIKYIIINLIEKKNNNYEESKFEKSLRAKSKKELEEELELKEKIIKEEIKQFEEKDKEQIEINEKIKTDLNEYKEFIEEEGNSEKYPWSITTELYDEKLKKFDDILEGYLISSAEFIEKKTSNVKYAMEYIKELVGYYNEKMNAEEKKDLQKRVFNLFDVVNDLSYETPKIFDVYSYVIYIFIEYNIIEIKNLENIFREEFDINDISTINKIFLNIYEYHKSDSFKKELKKFRFINENKEIFQWIYSLKDKNK